MLKFASPIEQVRRLPYMPQLDSLRAIAVFGVFIEHFIRLDDPVRRLLPWGWLGVRMFFVLSGFLITGLLLAQRDEIDAGHTSKGLAFRDFYVRRLLRLSPACYANLIFCALFLVAARPYIPFFAVYLQNFLFAAQPMVFRHVMGHFWTLAVEEQFYLTWAFIVVLTPRSRLVRVISMFIAGGVVFRIAGLAMGFSPFSVEMMMPSHFDTLAAGGLLAVLRRESELTVRVPRITLTIGAPCLLCFIVCKQLELLNERILMAVGESAAALFFVWLIHRASIGFEGSVGWLLRRRTLIYLGTISYGLYVYHFNVPGMMRVKLLPVLGINLPEKNWMTFVIFAVVTIIIASISWFGFESVIKKLPVYIPRWRRELRRTRGGGTVELTEGAAAAPKQ